MGLVTNIHFGEGARVAKGDVLISFDSGIQRAEIEVSRAEIAVHLARLENARQLYARAERLMQTQNIPEARVDELAANLKAAEAEVKRWEAALAATRVRLSKREVRAPFAGRLGMRNISVGALVEPGDPIVTLDDIAVIKLDFQVPERYLAYLQPGQEVAASTEAYPGKVFFGQVSSIDSRVDAVTRAVTIRALIDNADEALKPGMFLLVELGISTRHQAVIIPEEAVVANGTQRYVFVVEEGQARQSSVELGQRMPGEVEVVSGVVAGEAVIVGGVQKVRDGANVAPRPTEAAAAEYAMVLVLSDISIKRPVFATVVSLVLIIFGLFAFDRLAVREYPDIDPPTVSIVTLYKGASAQIMETQVTQIIEESIAGIEGIKLITSKSREERSQVDIEFVLGRDVDAAANDVRDKVARSIGSLPLDVEAPIVSKVEATGTQSGKPLFEACCCW